MIRVLVVGLGNMGLSHALAYHHQHCFQIVGLVNRTAVELPRDLNSYDRFDDFYTALSSTTPDLVCIATYSDTHADYAIAAIQAGAHVFVEKPLATNTADAIAVARAAKDNDRKLVVGYILRHHPSWQRMIAEAKSLGGPYVFRLNLNQQSTGDEWSTHKQLMQTTPPIVDCGVHYVDVMCQITDAAPVQVRGMGLRLSDEIALDMYNYGHFQVLFADGSVGWYEAGWGPMMSETAFFVKDVISPGGAVSIVAQGTAGSSDIGSHTKVGRLLVHPVADEDRLIALEDEPDHQELCDAEQAFVGRAILENINLSRHALDAVQSLAICLAADESVRSGRAVDIQPLKL